MRGCSREEVRGRGLRKKFEGRGLRKR